MQHVTTTLGLMVLCVCGSGFFSGSETAVTAVNRYRLHYLATIKKTPNAKTLLAMLAKPQKLLGMILIANTFLNILVSSLATEMTITLLGPEYVLATTVVLTLVVLIFAEVLPKSVAAQKTDTIAYAVAPILHVLLWLMRPLVIVVDAVTTGLMWILGIRFPQGGGENLSRDELGNLIKQRRISAQDGEVEQMLEGILDLDDMLVTDVMLPRGAIEGIDVSLSWQEIIKTLKLTERERLLIYDDTIDQIKGYIDIRTIMRCLLDNKLSKDILLKKMRKIRYVPESMSLELQLQKFKVEGESMVAIVDEYGDLTGIVEREDIIDEVVGEFAKGLTRSFGPVSRSGHQEYWFDGSMAVRDINKILHWSLPEDGATTIGGLVLEYLECIPEGRLSLVVSGYRIEVLQIRNNQIHRLRVKPPETSNDSIDAEA